MLTVEEVKDVAARAAEGNRRSIALFRELCLAVGIAGRSGGWIYLPAGTKSIGHGWQSVAKLFATSQGWTATDLLVEMSKRSATDDDIAAAEVEAYATAPAAEIVVTFDRIGRSHDVVVHLDADLANDRTELARQLRKIARKYNASKEFELWIDYDLGEVLIDGGRFGRGEVKGLPQVVCDCDGTHAPIPGGHSVACRKRETLYMIDRSPIDEQHAAALAMNAKYEAPQRAARFAVAFEHFTRLADSGGPGTSAGVIAAVESATTVTEEQLARACARADCSTPDEDTLGAARDLLRELGFAVVATL